MIVKAPSTHGPSAALLAELDALLHPEASAHDEVDDPLTAEPAPEDRVWQGSLRSVPPASLHGWVEDVATSEPNRTAVSCGEARMTYAELQEQSSCVASALADRQIGPGDLVAVCLPRDERHPAVLLGVLRSGAAFLPLDPTHPPQRLAELVAEARPQLLLHDQSVAPGLTQVEVDVRSCVRPDGPLPVVSVRGDDVAYVMFTSGTSGSPKGVEVTHRAVVGFLHGVSELLDLTTDDRVLGYAASTFDVSIFETFGALVNGAELCLTEPADRLDLDRLQALLETRRVTVTDLPPAVMALLQPDRLPALRVVFVGGEAFPVALVDRWAPGRRFVNGYGPTECTVTMIVHDCVAGEESTPIGLPMANHVAHVVDERDRLVPVGVPGELLIGGIGLARGYRNRPELTEQTFMDDPFGHAPGGRLYRTGDLVRRCSDGALVFLGRTDRQLKVRGVRIEPAEVEAALSRLDGVRQSVVDLWEDRSGQRHLTAWVAGEQVLPASVRAALAERLPRSLVPDHVVVLTGLPLTSSGKIDRAALPAPVAGADRPNPVTAALARPTQATGPAEAFTETESILATELFAPLIGLEEVPLAVSFFDLGGSSLQAAQLLSRVRRRFGVELAVADFFRDATVAGLAAVVDATRAVALDDEHLVAFVAGLTDVQADRVLAAMSHLDAP